MFRKTDTAQQTVTISFDGNPVQVEVGQTVAAALLGHGIGTFRTSVVSNQPRGPYYLMGVCFECLVTIDGIQNRQACMTLVREGMSVSSQHGAQVAQEGR